MKLKQILLPFTAAVFALSLLPACSSDPNPVGYLNAKDAKTYVEVNLNVASTRATEEVENAISKVYLYVFDSNSYLEGEPIVVDNVSDNSVIVETTPGVKTIYAVANQDIITSASITKTDDNKISLSAFRDALVETANLTTYTKTSSSVSYTNFVMCGMCTTGSLQVTTSKLNLPTSNVISIELERMVAKIQMAYKTSDASDWGIKRIDSYEFKICQTPTKMRLVHNDAKDVFAEFTNTVEDGTYDEYNYDSSLPYLSVPTSFNNTKCFYIPENITSNPTTGNTTYITFSCSLTPTEINTFQANTNTLKIANYAVVTFYTIGIYEKDGTFVDYHRLAGDGMILFMADEQEAREYIDMRPNFFPDIYDYKVLTFKNGTAYYRINISDGEGEYLKYRVLRNKCYKITINGVKGLGVNDEKLLRPDDPSSPLEKGVQDDKSFVSSSFTIAGWDDEEQEIEVK